MRLLGAVLFCSSLRLIVCGNEVLTDADCDDQSIFEAVDLALNVYNIEKEDGNQLMLYRITDAKTRLENDNLLHTFVSYDVRESSCGVKSGKLWQECDYKTPEIALGKCSVHVLVNTEHKSSDVVSQNCSLPIVEPTVSVVQLPCLGCDVHIDTNNEEVLKNVQAAIERMNSLGNHPFLFDVEDIQKATRQVVRGWIYKIEYKVRQTNCSKSIFSSVTSEECELDKDGQPGHCKSRVFVTPKGEINDISLECISDTGFCLSCPNEVEPRDPVLLNLLKDVINEYNSNSNNTYLFNVLTVVKATKQASNGIIYDVNFKIKETNCTKLDYVFLEEECHSLPSAEILSCNANINVTDKNTRSSYECSTQPLFTSASRISLKGLSPLRMSLPESRVLRRAVRGLKKSKCGPNHKGNKGNKHGKKDKKKPNHKHCDSSEESGEDERKEYDVTVKPPVPATTTQIIKVFQTTQIPIVSLDHGEETTHITPPLFPVIPSLPEDEGIFPNIHDDVLLDLPDLETAPRCPGKLWQRRGSLGPVTTLKPHISPSGIPSHDQAQEQKSPQPFTDEDLLSILDFKR
ncbi:T-kininogen 1-like [Spea bombifrons]|uniref:T-kininogen 1-like n=1 Tax=Spea bombifrons TaxID=233779 RepID=UPI00234B66E7|nr:T-kininogen 1-like [Spea bombifrons]